jgi:hypothetical protein
VLGIFALYRPSITPSVLHFDSLATHFAQELVLCDIWSGSPEAYDVLGGSSNSNVSPSGPPLYTPLQTPCDPQSMLTISGRRLGTARRAIGTAQFGMPVRDWTKSPDAVCWWRISRPRKWWKDLREVERSRTVMPYSYIVSKRILEERKTHTV